MPNPEMDWAITADNLFKSYGKVKALRGLSLRVPRGAVYGLLGVNGAGKTTTLGILSGFVGRFRGNCLVAGRLGCLPQDAALAPARAAAAQFRFFARLGGASRHAAPGEVKRCLESAGMADCARRRPGGLSHGQRKRLALAQALLNDPEIILLDEPTAGLDPGQAVRIKRLIADLAGEKTIVLSSHQLSEVEELCSVAGVIHEGKMIYEGSIQTLKGAGNRVRYRLSAPAGASAVLGLNGVREAEAESSPPLLKVVFDPGTVSLEELNFRVVEALRASGAGVCEISRGGSLEEGFLELLA